MESYETITEAIADLKEKGYTTDFNLNQSSIECSQTNSLLQPDEFIVDTVYRFEGMTDPADEMILYAISSTSKKMRGLLVNGYGIYSDTLTDEMIAKLK